MFGGPIRAIRSWSSAEYRSSTTSATSGWRTSLRPRWPISATARRRCRFSSCRCRRWADRARLFPPASAIRSGWLTSPGLWWSCACIRCAGAWPTSRVGRKHGGRATCDGVRPVRHLSGDPRRNVVRALAGSKLDDANLGETFLAEGVLAGDRFDFFAAPADGENDAAVARDLPARHQEVAGGVVLLQEADVRRHVGVDCGEVRFVDQLDDEHDP